MRPYLSVAPLFCGFASAVFLGAWVFLGPDLASAQEPEKGAGSCSCPDPRKPDIQRLWPRPKLAEAAPAHAPQTAPVLNVGDEVATLEAVQLALSEVGDGSTYVWHLKGGALSGAVLPTTSFKDAQGKICRHLVLTLSASGTTRQTEGVACRLPNGVWQLDG